ncbi:MAG: efflux transporter outer membrane subunit [Deltaproteobacteria bacterium]|nr:efflux transporter outer membrane subunit [Deltaproteobacteria bacterium]
MNICKSRFLRTPRFLRITLLLLLLCQVMFGCSLSPKYEKISVPGDAAKSFYGQSNAKAFSDNSWWTDFNDPCLNGLIKNALAGSPDAIAALLNVEAYRQQAVIASAPLFPDLSLSADATRTKVNLNTFLPFGNSFTNNAFGLSLTASYEVDLWKRLSNAQKRARIAILSARENQKTVYLTLVSNICDLYFRLSEQDAEVLIAKQIGGIHKKLLADAKRRYLDGAIDSSALAAARKLRAEALQAISGAQSLARSFAFQINALSGRNPTKDIVVSGFDGINSGLAPVPAGLPSSLLSRRPDVRAAEDNVRAALLAIGIAKAALLPSVRLTASTGYKSSDLSDLIDHYSSVWTLAGGIAAPLFNRGAKKAAVKQAQIEAKIAVQKYISTALSAFKDVDFALSVYADIKERLVLEDEKIFAQQVQFENAKLDYLSGTGSYAAFLNNRILMERAKIAKNRLVLELLQNRVQLMTALGGGFWYAAASPKTSGEKQ